MANQWTEDQLVKAGIDAARREVAESSSETFAFKTELALQELKLESPLEALFVVWWHAFVFSHEDPLQLIAQHKVSCGMRLLRIKDAAARQRVNV
jgi:hypothetical protein